MPTIQRDAKNAYNAVKAALTRYKYRKSYRRIFAHRAHMWGLLMEDHNLDDKRYNQNDITYIWNDVNEAKSILHPLIHVLEYLKSDINPGAGFIDQLLKYNGCKWIQDKNDPLKDFATRYETKLNNLALFPSSSPSTSSAGSFVMVSPQSPGKGYD